MATPPISYPVVAVNDVAYTANTVVSAVETNGYWGNMYIAACPVVPLVITYCCLETARAVLTL
jgi:hypothetical protein